MTKHGRIAALRPRRKAVRPELFGDLGRVAPDHFLEVAELEADRERVVELEERVDFAGDYYQLRRATIYDRPEQEIPIYVAAAGATGSTARGPRASSTGSRNVPISSAV